MKIAICDDTELDLQNLNKLIQDYSKQYNVPITVDLYTDPTILLNHVILLNETEYSIFFLDIIMDKNGIDVAAQFRKIMTDVPIVFTTSSKEFAIDAFKVKAYDYLLKPVTKRDLFATLDELIKTIKTTFKSTFNIKLDDLSYTTININEIAYIEQRDRRLVYHMSNGDTYITTSIRGKFLDEIPFEISAYNFINCHSSFVVNMNKIKSISDYSFIMKNGDNIPISKRILKQVRETYAKYLLGE